jgi:antitoxin MazE
MAGLFRGFNPCRIRGSQSADYPQNHKNGKVRRFTPAPAASLDQCINNVYPVIIGVYLMEAVVKKWGNSLGIRISSLIARELSLQDGSFVEINDTGNEIIIKPIQKNLLSEMLSKINAQNIHEEAEAFGPVGKEIW